MRLLFAAMLVATFCVAFFSTPLQARPLVVASIEPLSMLVRDVLGDDVEVRTLLLPGQNPHHASMTPGQARLVRDADLLVWLGADAEPHVARLVRRRDGDILTLLDLDGVHTRPEQDSEHDHQGHRHHHSGLADPHLWLYPDNMRLLAAALAGDQPAQAETFERQLAALEKRLAVQLAPVAARRYLSHHDAWAYFAEAFSLQRPLVISPNLEASASSRRFVELSRQVERLEIGCILAEPEGSRALLRRLCEDCRLVEADPLGRGLAGGGYLEFLEWLAGRFATCLAD